MIPRNYVKYVAPPLLFICMLLDAHINRIFTSVFTSHYLMNAHLMVLAILVMSEVVNRRFMIGTMLAIGILYDVYYVGVIGIYAVILPLIVILIYLFGQVIYQSLLTLFYSMIIFVTFFELGSSFLQLIFQLAHVNSQFFVTRFLGPTLALNIIMFVILIVPFRRVLVEQNYEKSRII
ncbi:rod shape-determining protein MreD [Enterococcus sp. AZ109]|uniref:rod shape-determining protein MreD n=1 Tax=Enterococcus sp. AZ109 TaxID=2774634 RepID=UPI003F223796